MLQTISDPLLAIALGAGACHSNYICKYGMGYVLVALIFSKAANKKKQYKPLPGYKYEIH